MFCRNVSLLSYFKELLQFIALIEILSCKWNRGKLFNLNRDLEMEFSLFTYRTYQELILIQNFQSFSGPLLVINFWYWSEWSLQPVGPSWRYDATAIDMHSTGYVWRLLCQWQQQSQIEIFSRLFSTVLLEKKGTSFLDRRGLIPVPFRSWK